MDAKGKDAARYRWLRRTGPTDWPAVLFADPDLDEDGFDAAIDAEMAGDDNDCG